MNSNKCIVFTRHLTRNSIGNCLGSIGILGFRMADYPRSLGSRDHCLDFGRDGFKDVGGSLVGSVTTFPPALEGDKLIHERIDIEFIDRVFQSINQCGSESLQIVLVSNLPNITV